MSDFSDTWNLSRERFLKEISGLSAEQLQWQVYPGALSIGAMAIHLAGVELSFITQLLELSLSPEEAKLKAAGTDGVVNDLPFPYAEEDITPELVLECLDRSKAILEPHITAPTKDILTREIKSALGPMISGQGAFVRMSFHPAYHHGQAYLIKNSPGFPSQ